LGWETDVAAVVESSRSPLVALCRWHLVGVEVPGAERSERQHLLQDHLPEAKDCVQYEEQIENLVDKLSMQIHRLQHSCHQQPPAD
jgi:hypothetical protein